MKTPFNPNAIASSTLGPPKKRSEAEFSDELNVVTDFNPQPKSSAPTLSLQQALAGISPDLIPKVDLTPQVQELKGMESGYTAPQYEAQWSSLAGRLNAQQQAAQRALAAKQGQMGVRGGAGSAQFARQQQLMAAQRAMAGQELTVKNIDEQYKRMQQRQEMERQQQLANQAAEALRLQMAQAELDRQSQERIASEAAAAQVKAAETGGGCCFIFLEANDGVLDRIARRARDELMTPRNLRGYYKLSEVLVPLMRKSKVFKGLVKYLMVKPMIAAGKWYYGESKINRIFAPIACFYLNLFEYLGQDHLYLRDNGELI